MPQILVTPAAQEDLINLWVYIAHDNPKAADYVYQAAEETFENLVLMPRSGTLYRSKRPKLRGLRFFPIKHFYNYMIYYRETQTGIEIVRVLHAHMKRERQLKEEKKKR